MPSLRLKKGSLLPKVLIPSSKSYANRALILAALTDNSPAISNLPEATDVTILVDCLKKLGLEISRTEDRLKFLNSFPACEKSGLELSVGEGGTTARFLAVMLLLGSCPYRLILGERLKARPWNDFLQLANSYGAKASLEDNVLAIQGPVHLPKVLEIDCSKTTQFATAFELIASQSKGRVIPTNLSSSMSYWAMTEKLITEMKGAINFSVPLDWSSASYPLAFGALNHSIDLPGLFPDPLQADSKFYQVLKSFGAIEDHPWGLRVSPVNSMHALKMDVSDALDLVPTLGFFLAHIEGDHQLIGIENLIHKESDRLTEVIHLLKLFGRDSSTDGKTLFIKGHRGRVEKALELRLPNDHRMVMVGALFLLHHNGGELSPVEAVDKSYPDFFDVILGV